MGESKHGARRFLDRARHMQNVPRWAVCLLQLALFGCSAVFAFLLRFDFSIPPVYLPYLILALPIWMLVKTEVFRLYGLDRGWWRFLSVDDLCRIAVGNLLASCAGGIVVVMVIPRGFPRSLYILDFLISLLLTGSLRVLTRVIQDSLPNGGAVGRRGAVLIYGAGSAGVTLLREIRSNASLPYEVLGFIDDNRHKRGLVIHGAKVLGCGSDLAALALKLKPDEVLIAIPSATGGEISHILACCHTAGVRCRTVPGLADVIEGRALANQIRDVAVEDLLGRTPVTLEERRIRSTLEGKMVLVTGAAGSIGSELCRQIARFSPAGIVGFEIAESPLFEIDREMRGAFPGTPFHPEIGSIQNRARIDEVVRQYAPSVIYHAAAYKHVPMMEAHVFEAIENNVFGTFNIATAAAEHRVEDFVMISSDKAVRPNNVMGATKRICELLLLAMQNGGTKYVVVRFGNVLGSNGSVIPIFKKQIAAGGPVTVTHPDMRRFFMTIPEACQLVLEAGVIADGGQICVLEMGEPVRIVDLARNLIVLSGFRPDDEIKIQFTGVRPGEKLYEELSTMLEDTLPTAHEKIRMFVGNGVPEGNVSGWLERLRQISAARDTGRLLVTLKEMVPDYSPSAELLRRVIETAPRKTTPKAMAAAAGAH